MSQIETTIRIGLGRAIGSIEVGAAQDVHGVFDHGIDRLELYIKSKQQSGASLGRIIIGFVDFVSNGYE